MTTREETSVLAADWYERFSRDAQDLYPEVDYSKAHCLELAEKSVAIMRLTVEKEELLLAHYYQRPEIQEVAERVGFVGDSLGLALEAKKILEMPPDELSKSVGRKISRVRMSAVRFMGDTAKVVLGDAMRVFMPRFAGCSLVASLQGMRTIDFSKTPEPELSRLLLTEQPRVTAYDVWLKNNPTGIILSYMNSTPDAKRKSWAVFTSRNALKVLEYAMRENPGSPVLMLPDKHLTAVILGMARRENNPWINPDLVTPFDGACHVHEQKINAGALDEALDRYPDAALLVHPECGCALECMARAASGTLGRKSYFSSTQEMIGHATKPENGNEFIVATESGMIYTLRKHAPGRKFWPVTTNAQCEFMKATTVDALLESLASPSEESYEVILPADVIREARRPIERMLSVR